MRYTSAAESFHTKKLCSILSSKESQLLYGKRTLCVLLSFLGGRGVEAMYALIRTLFILGLSESS